MKSKPLSNFFSVQVYFSLMNDLLIIVLMTHYSQFAVFMFVLFKVLVFTNDDYSWHSIVGLN